MIGAKQFGREPWGYAEMVVAFAVDVVSTATPLCRRAARRPVSIVAAAAVTVARQLHRSCGVAAVTATQCMRGARKAIVGSVTSVPRLTRQLHRSCECGVSAAVACKREITRSIMTTGAHWIASWYDRNFTARRTCRVPAENRVFTVPAENRVFSVPAER